MAALGFKLLKEMSSIFKLPFDRRDCAICRSSHHHRLERERERDDNNNDDDERTNVSKKWFHSKRVELYTGEMIERP